jgi:DNA/RNA endonuclease YhcR with UshA esterase domain
LTAKPLRLIGVFRGIRMKKLTLFLATIFCVALISAPLLAHHGEANYDTEKIVSVKGTVTDFQFVNPHVQISLDVKNDKGEIEKWVGEARSPAMLSRYGGWDKNTIKVGDVITIYGHRTKNGTPFMRLDKIVMADGKELTNL